MVRGQRSPGAFLVLIFVALSNAEDVFNPASRFMRYLAVPPGEFTALSALYSSTEGDSWSNYAQWMSGDPCTNSWFVNLPIPRSLPII